MTDLTVRPDGPEGQPDNVTPAFDWSPYARCPRRSCSAASGNPCQDLGPVSYSGPALSYALLPHAERPLVDRREPACPHGYDAEDACKACTPPKAEVIHFDAGRVDQYAACGYDLDRNGPEGWTTDRAKVTCSACELEITPDATPVEPERRTVSVERLTDELRAVAAAERTAHHPGYMARTGRALLDQAVVGVIARVGTESAAVDVVDTDWTKLPPPVLLARLIEHARSTARDGDAELLMPTPDVLAALDGRPDAQLLTAPIWVLAMDVTAGMLLAPESAAPQRLVTERPECTDPECEFGSCAVFIVAELPGELHQSGYARVRVRIPAAVTA